MSTADTANRMQEPEEPHDVTRPEPHHAVPYYKCFALLVILTAMTVGVYYLFNYIHIENELVRVLAALLVASIKASVVALFFMHLKFEGKLIYTIFIVPLLLCVLLTVALIPDVLLTHPSDHTSSLKTFNDAKHLFMSAVGGENADGSSGVGGH